MQIYVKLLNQGGITGEIWYTSEGILGKRRKIAKLRFIYRALIYLPIIIFEVVNYFLNGIILNHSLGHQEISNRPSNVSNKRTRCL